MFSPVRLRVLWSELVYRFGIHCATHQIRVILISGVVITSLFYPALAGLSTSQPLSSFPSHWLDLLFSPPSDSLQHRHFSDLVALWRGPDQQSLRVLDDAATRARCGLESTIRVERVLVPPTAYHEHGVLNHDTLLASLGLQHLISTSINHPQNAFDCVLDPATDVCFHTSPLAFWDNDADTVIYDEDLLSTINDPEANITAAGIAVLPQMVLAARAYRDHHGLDTDYATYLAFTYYFRETDCLGDAGHNAWKNAIDQLVSNNVQVEHAQTEPDLIALQFDTGKPGPRFSIISMALYLCYVLVFIHFSGSLRRMNTVHSRFGLAFTGIIEILVSTITSLSVCTIWGFRVTMVPWGILPIVIVFVGAENMFSLVEAVVQTSIALPVKVRIASGLRKAGTSNTLKVVTYNAILGTISFFAHGAIRQFCVFAIVVLVAHWFLIHTFFIAVLSIDIQRLELSELLTQDKMADSPTTRVKDKTPPRTKMGRWNSILRGRAARNGSLLLLLAFTAALYYVTYPFPSQPPSPAYSHLQRPPPPAITSPFWALFNPSSDALLHLRIQPPSLIHLIPDPMPTPRFSFRKLRPLYWAIKIVILPIAATIGCLYALLVYLLRGAEHLEAQRLINEKQAKGEMEGEVDGVGDEVAFRTLKRACVADVERVTVSADGNVVLTSSLDGEVVMWRHPVEANFGTAAGKKSPEPILIPFLDISPGAYSPSPVPTNPTSNGRANGGKYSPGLGNGHANGNGSANGHPSNNAHPGRRVATALALNDTGRVAAIGTGDGAIGLWVVSEQRSKSKTKIVRGPVFRPPLPMSYGKEGEISREDSRDSSMPFGKVQDIMFVRSSPIVDTGLPPPPLASSSSNALNTGSENGGPPGFHHQRSLSENSLIAAMAGDVDRIGLVVMYEGGVVVEWSDCLGASSAGLEKRDAGEGGGYVVQPTLRGTASGEARVILLRNAGLNGNPSLAFLFKDGMVEILDYIGSMPSASASASTSSSPPKSSSWTSRCIFQGCMSSDSIVQIESQVLDIGSNPRPVLAIISSAGFVSLWDGALGECIAVADDLYSSPPTNSLLEDQSAVFAIGRPASTSLRFSPNHDRAPPQIRLSSIPPAKPCPQCHELSVDSFLLTFSVGQDVTMYRAFLSHSAGVRRCECPLRNNAGPPTLGGMGGGASLIVARPRSRSGSIASSAAGTTSSPARSRASTYSRNTNSTLLAAPVTEYPVSGHGFHSRRASEKGDKAVSRRSSTTMLQIPPPFASTTDEQTADREDSAASTAAPSSQQTPQMQQGIRLAPNVSPDLSPESVWFGMKLVKVVDVPCERGGWDVLGSKVFGLRRKSRLELIPRRRKGPNGSAPSAGTPASNASNSGCVVDQVDGGADGAGLSYTVLERWQLWTYDPSRTDSALCASTLSTVAIASSSLDSTTLAGAAGGLSTASPARNGPSSLVQRRQRTNGTRSSSSSFGKPTPRSSSISSSASVTKRSVSSHIADELEEDDEEEYPRLPFTRVLPFMAAGKHGHRFCVAGFGNTVGLIGVQPSANGSLPSSSSTSPISSSIATNGSVDFTKKRQ